MLERLRVELAEESDANDWNHVVAEAANSTPFHLWEFSRSLTKAYGYKFYGFVARNRDDDIVALLPMLQVRSLMFGNRLISVPFSEHGGPIGDSHAFPWLLDAARQLGSKLGVNQLELRDSSPDLSVIDSRFLTTSRYVTFELKLDNDFEKRLGRKTRNTIRRAARNLPKTRELSAVDLSGFYDVYLETQKRLGSPPHSLKFFQSLFWSLGGGVLRCLAAELEGEITAAIVLFVQKPRIFWWSSVSRTRFTKMSPTTLLLWQTARWGLDNGLSSFDFGRTRVGSTVYAFKSHWGGQQRPLVEHIMTFGSRHSNPDPDQRLFRVLSHGWSALPIAVQRRVGPRLIRGIAL